MIVEAKFFEGQGFWEGFVLTHYDITFKYNA